MSVEFGYTPPVAISDQERDAFVQFAQSAVRAAGEVILPHFRSGVQVTNKLENGGFDPVTLRIKPASGRFARPSNELTPSMASLARSTDSKRVMA